MKPETRKTGNCQHPLFPHYSENNESRNFEYKQSMYFTIIYTRHIF